MSPTELLSQGPWMPCRCWMMPVWLIVTPQMTQFPPSSDWKTRNLVSCWVIGGLDSVIIAFMFLETTAQNSVFPWIRYLRLNWQTGKPSGLCEQPVFNLSSVFYMFRINVSSCFTTGQVQEADDLLQSEGGTLVSVVKGWLAGSSLWDSMG